MHYANGEVAKEGDLVVGKTYNSPGIVVGIIHSINPDSETCNCQVMELARKIGPSVVQRFGNDYTACSNLNRVDPPTIPDGAKPA